MTVQGLVNVPKHNESALLQAVAHTVSGGPAGCAAGVGIRSSTAAAPLAPTWCRAAGGLTSPAPCRAADCGGHLLRRISGPLAPVSGQGCNRCNVGTANTMQRRRVPGAPLPGAPTGGTHVLCTARPLSAGTEAASWAMPCSARARWTTPSWWPAMEPILPPGSSSERFFLTARRRGRRGGPLVCREPQLPAGASRAAAGLAAWAAAPCAASPAGHTAARSCPARRPCLMQLVGEEQLERTLGRAGLRPPEAQPDAQPGRPGGPGHVSGIRLQNAAQPRPGACSSPLLQPASQPASVAAALVRTPAAAREGGGTVHTGGSLSMAQPLFCVALPTPQMRKLDGPSTWGPLQDWLKGWRAWLGSY